MMIMMMKNYCTINFSLCLMYKREFISHGFFPQELSPSYIHLTDIYLTPLPGIFIQLQMLKSLPRFGLDSCP